jgi:hypothetical protein
LVDRERQDKDLREVFETDRGAYRRAAEDAFVLQKRTLSSPEPCLRPAGDLLDLV